MLADSLRAIGLFVLLVGCSSPASPQTTSPGGCVPYVSDAGLSVPSVSFARDVMPIFESNCATAGASCHGDPSVVTSAVPPRPFLGYPLADGGAAVVQQVRAGLVDVESNQDLSMSLVAPGDPGRSFLMHKIDGDQCTLTTECAMGDSVRPNCGSFMPYQAPEVLAVSLRDTVRRWIAQGALAE